MQHTLSLLAAAASGCMAVSQLILPFEAYAQPVDYPKKAVRMVVPLAPGGGSDIVGRIVAQALTERWGKTVVVDNRPGAGSAVGTAIAAKAAPDGYTLLVSSSSVAITPALYPNLHFDVLRDLAPVTLIASQPSVLVVHPSVAAASVKDLIAVASTQKLAYGSAGVGSATHLGTELLLQAAKVRVLHVPYQSAGQATTAVLGGETQMLLTNMASVLPHITTGRLRPIGISSLKRSAATPEIPTLSESGLPGFEYATWYGMLAPAGTNRHSSSTCRRPPPTSSSSPPYPSSLPHKACRPMAPPPQISTAICERKSGGGEESSRTRIYEENSVVGSTASERRHGTRSG